MNKHSKNVDPFAGWAEPINGQSYLDPADDYITDPDGHLEESCENANGEKVPSGSSGKEKIATITAKASAAGKPAKKTDIMNPMMMATLESLAAAGSRILFTEEQWWLYQRSLGYWVVCPGHFMDHVIDTLYRQLIGTAPTMSLVNEVRNGVQRMVFKLAPPWRGLTKNLIVFRGGAVVNMDTGMIETQNPDLYMREDNSIDQPWIANATCPLWDKTINFLLEHIDADDRVGAKALVEEWMGSSLFRINRPRSISRAMVFWGKAHTGKSTILEILQMVWGDNKFTSASMSDLSQTFGLQGFMGKALWTCDEKNERNASLEPEWFKKIVTNEQLTVNRKFMPTWTGRLNMTVGLVCNTLPDLGDNPEAMHDRIIFMGMDTVVVNEDPTLKDRLSLEAPGILQRMWQAGLRLKERGRFVIPASVNEKQEDIKAENDPFSDFVKNGFVVGPAHEDHYVKFGDVMSAYRGYRASMEGRDAVKNLTFSGKKYGAMLSQLLPGTIRRKLKSGALHVRSGMAFTDQPGLTWLDAGWLIEDDTYKTNDARKQEANGTLGEVKKFRK